MSSFSRTEILIGDQNLQKLKESTVTICGLGGVGSYAVESIARAGIGNINLVDFDTVDPTNINRQLFALTSTIGQYKTDIAKKRVLDINPDCKVGIIKKIINEETMHEVIELPSDVIVDAIDSLSAKVFLIKLAMDNKIHIVSSMGAAGRMDANQITTGDLSKTRNCPLAKFVRRRLKRLRITKGVPCVYSTEMMIKAEKNDDGEDLPLGTISHITAIFGHKVAFEVMNYILKSE